MRVLGFALPAAALLIALTASASDAPKDLEPRVSWTVAEIPRQADLLIRLDTGAGVRISTWDRDQITVESNWSEERCPDARISLSRTASGATLESRYPPGQGEITHNCSFSLDVRVPREVNVAIRSAGGGIEITGLKGTVIGHTGGGRIALTEMNGTVNLRTGGGEIRVRDSDLDGRITTGGGRVSFVNVSGPVTARSGSVRGVVRGDGERREEAPPKSSRSRST